MLRALSKICNLHTNYVCGRKWIILISVIDPYKPEDRSLKCFMPYNRDCEDKEHVIIIFRSSFSRAFCACNVNAIISSKRNKSHVVFVMRSTRCDCVIRLTVFTNPKKSCARSIYVVRPSYIHLPVAIKRPT